MSEEPEKQKPEGSGIRFFAITVTAFLASVPCFGSPIYLRCPIDGRPNALGFDFLIDVEAKSMAFVFGDKPSPMPEPVITPLALTSTFESNGTVFYRYSINRNTLRFIAYQSGPDGRPVVLSGQCEVTHQRL